MKNLIIASLTILTITLSFAQSPIEKADKLIQERKYNSAFKLLQEADENNTDVDITLKKVDIASEYFAISMMHQMFALKDLKEGEDLFEIRKNMDNQSLPMYMLPINEILDSLITKHPKQYKLHKSLGYYYYDVHLKYGDNWIMDSKEVIEKMYDYSKIAAENNEADFMTHYCLGYYHTLNENYDKAIPHFLNSIKANPLYPTSHYNLSICYMYNKQIENGIPHAIKSIELYKDEQLKSDAARVTGVLYKEINDYKNALKYFKQSDEILPDSYYTINQLLEVQLHLNLIEDSKVTATNFFKLTPTNPRICSDLVDIYSLTKKEKELIDFFNTKIEEHSSEKEILGNIYFHLGQYYYSIEAIDKAKGNFEKAKTSFESVLEKDHYVFEVINKTLEELK